MDNFTNQRAISPPRRCAGQGGLLHSIALVVALVGSFFIFTQPSWAVESTNVPPLLITADHSNGVYAVGQLVYWRVEVKGESLSNMIETSYALKNGGLTLMRKEKLALTDGAAEIETETTEPATLAL